MALFGEKYDDDVRVLTIGRIARSYVAVPMCGVGDVGLFKIMAETGVAAGVRRVEAVTGDAALDWLDDREALFIKCAGVLKTDPEALETRVFGLLGRIKTRTKIGKDARPPPNSSVRLVEQAVDVNGIRVLSVRLDGADAKSLRDLDRFKNRMGSGVVVLGADGDKVALIAGVTDDLTDKVQTGLVNHVASKSVERVKTPRHGPRRWQGSAAGRSLIGQSLGQGQLWRESPQWPGVRSLNSDRLGKELAWDSQRGPDGALLLNLAASVGDGTHSKRRKNCDRHARCGHEVVVVLSAMSGETDRLIAGEASSSPSARG